MKIGDNIMRVTRESFPKQDQPYKVERFHPDGTKAVLRYQYKGKPSGKAVAVKVANIKEQRPTIGTFNGTFYKTE